MTKEQALLVKAGDRVKHPTYGEGFIVSTHYTPAFLFINFAEFGIIECKSEEIELLKIVNAELFDNLYKYAQSYFCKDELVKVLSGEEKAKVVAYLERHFKQ